MESNAPIPLDIQRQIDRIAEVCAERKPLVAINCIAYNHELYIRDALEGFVNQKTNFPFVAIVHDDASTDSTANIIREYAKKYPDIIKPIYETENQYSKKDGSLGRIMDSAIEAAGAKYVAMCEGDDYWTDPHKLQKQVDFLETHPDYSLCFHNTKLSMLDGSIRLDASAMKQTGEYSADDIIEQWIIPTASVVYRREGIDNNPIRINPKFKYGDNILFLTAALNGRLFGINEYMSVYRKNPTSITIRLSEIEWLKLDVIHYKEMCKVFSSIISKRVRHEALAERYYQLSQLLVRNDFKQSLIYLFRGIFNCSPEIWKYILGSIRRKFTTLSQTKQ